MVRSILVYGAAFVIVVIGAALIVGMQSQQPRNTLKSAEANTPAPSGYQSPPLSPAVTGTVTGTVTTGTPTMTSTTFPEPTDTTAVTTTGVVTTSTSVPVTITSQAITITTTPIPISAAPTATATVVPTSSMSPGTAHISITTHYFTPSPLTIPRHSSIVWTNQDSRPHSIMSDIGAPVAFQSGLIQPGGTYQFTFTQPGTYVYSIGTPPEVGVIIVT